jgi:methionine synthase II (cobalamin-independent)
VRFVLDAGLSIPFWPQLPKHSPREQMVAQFTEGLPCVRFDAREGRLRLDTRDKYAELERFYERFLAGDADAFALSSEAAEGFYAFLQAARGRTWPIVKGQVTGPVTLSHEIFDAEKRPLYGDPDLRDAAAKLLARKAEHQIARLGPLATERVLIFVDEPVLAAYGSSAYLGVTEDDVRELAGEVFQAVAGAGGISGMHVCGNSDWGMAIRTGVDVVNFDAYAYGTRLALFPEDVSDLLERGGCVAWGIVPTRGPLHAETPETLARRFDACVDALADKGLDRDRVLRRSLLTPSCGTGSVGPDSAERAFRLLVQLHEVLTGRTRTAD